MIDFRRDRTVRTIITTSKNKKANFLRWSIRDNEVLLDYGPRGIRNTFAHAIGQSAIEKSSIERMDENSVDLRTRRPDGTIKTQTLMRWMLSLIHI